MTDLDLGITVTFALAFLVGLAVGPLVLLRAGRLTVVVVRHSHLRPRGPDGRFLRDRDPAVGAAMEVAGRKTGGAT